MRRRLHRTAPRRQLCLMLWMSVANTWCPPGPAPRSLCGNDGNRLLSCITDQAPMSTPETGRNGHNRPKLQGNQEGNQTARVSVRRPPGRGTG